VRQAKAIQHAEARVDRVEGSAGNLTICFSIASFNELPAGDRAFYETTEAARKAGHGSRCVTSLNPAAAALVPGAKLDVYFTLANGGKIVIQRIATGASDL